VLLPSIREIEKRYVKDSIIKRSEKEKAKKPPDGRLEEIMDEAIEEIRSGEGSKKREPPSKDKSSRAFDNVKPIEPVPQPPNSVLPRSGREVEERINELKSDKNLIREVTRATSKKERDRIVEKMINELLLKEVNLPVVDALSVMPEFRQKLNRRLRNRGASTGLNL
jgi:hypothetical protein